MMFTRIHPLIFLPCCWLILASCATSKSETRPSPLAADSISMGDTFIKVTYSSPGVKKRKIWGNLVPYDHVWRTGANQASYLHVSKDILLSGERLEAGTYSIFTIPRSTEWIIIFNSDWDQWGAYNYDPAKDALRITVDPVITEAYQERMRFLLSDGSLTFHWENLTFSIPITPTEL